jgi:ATP-dependent 26S proteasome regulatory subunit
MDSNVVEAVMDIDEEEAQWTVDQFMTRTRLLENDIKVQKSELARLTHEEMTMKDKLKENQEKIKLNKQLPYLVANVQELLEQVSNLNWQMKWEVEGIFIEDE